MLADLDNLFEKLSTLKVAVIGDVMLDTYWWGHVERISPEAPVPVVLLDKREQRIGGAGNVALNINALGANAAIISVLGNDNDGAQLKNLLRQKNINTDFILFSDKRVTTNKTRIISRNQQMMRLDAEITNDLDADDEAKFQQSIEQYIKANKPDVIILQDYNKGILTSTIIKNVISLCKNFDIVCAVDPKRKNFFVYKDVTIFKPNLKEAKEGLNILSDIVSMESLNNIHKHLSAELQHEISLITLSDKGVFYQHEDNAKIISSHIRNIADVSGAGDTVIAVASLVYASSKKIHLMAEIANIAGGLVCEEVGTAVINKERLLNECRVLLN